MTFNHEQEAIFAAARDASSSLMVQALPGTGKTTVLVELLRYLKGTVFLCAYGKEAAAQLAIRALPIVGDEAGGRDPRVKIQTTHSLGMATWMRAQGFNKIKVERNKVRLIVQDVAPYTPLAAKYKGFMGRLVSLAKGAGLGVLSSIDNPANWMAVVERHNLTAELLYGADELPAIIHVAMVIYKKSLAQCTSVIDFDDQILAPLYFNARFVRYDNVLIDEAQDTSPLRLNMLMRLPKSTGRMIAVGDSNQAIMGFAGATQESMKEIQDMTEGLEFPLHISYRLTRQAALYASRFAPGLRAADGAPFGTMPIEVWMQPEKDPNREWDNNPVTRIENPGFWECGPFTKQDAILCRTTRPLVELAYQMIRRHIPCRIEGKDIGEGLERLANKWHSRSLEALETDLGQYKRAEVSRLCVLLKEDEAERINDQCETLSTLISATIEQGGRTLDDLLRLINSIFGDTPEGLPPDMCTLSTVHKAKGREWPRVFVLGYHQLMPSRRAATLQAIREERNLQFIAVTRHLRTLIFINLPEFKKKPKEQTDERRNDDDAPLHMSGVRDQEPDERPRNQSVQEVQAEPRRPDRRGKGRGRRDPNFSR